MKITNNINMLKIKTQDLKSWASVKRACQFDSGPGHHLQINQILSYVFLNSETLDQSGEKGYQYDMTDATVTPLFQGGSRG